MCQALSALGVYAFQSLGYIIRGATYQLRRTVNQWSREDWFGAVTGVLLTHGLLHPSFLEGKLDTRVDKSADTSHERGEALIPEAKLDQITCPTELIKYRGKRRVDPPKETVKKKKQEPVKRIKPG